MKKQLLPILLAGALLLSSCAMAAEETTAETTTAETSVRATTEKTRLVFTPSSTVVTKPVMAGKRLTFYELQYSIRNKGSSLVWGDLLAFAHTETYVDGYYVLRFDFGEDYYLLAGGEKPYIEEDSPEYVYVARNNSPIRSKDIREEGAFGDYMAKFPTVVSPQVKVEYLDGTEPYADRFWTCLSYEDTAMLCDIVNCGEWVGVGELDSYSLCYFNFDSISAVYYTEQKCIYDYDRSRAMYLSDEDAEWVNQMIASYHIEQMTMDDVRSFVEKGSLTWGDLAIYDGKNRATSISGAIFTIDENYTFVAYGTARFRSDIGLTCKLYSEKDGTYIIIFEQDLERFLSGDLSDPRELAYEADGDSYRIDDVLIHSPFMAEQTETLCEIAREAEWFVGTRSTKNFEFQYKIGKNYFYYDADTSILMNTTNNRTTVLSETDAAKILAILSAP